MEKYYTISDGAVLEAALLLMLENGTTTTLEVKQVLRAHGYWAIQADVSVLMQQLAIIHGWDYFDTGRFRLYFLDPAYDPGMPALHNEYFLN